MRFPGILKVNDLKGRGRGSGHPGPPSRSAPRVDSLKPLVMVMMMMMMMMMMVMTISLKRFRETSQIIIEARKQIVSLKSITIGTLCNISCHFRLNDNRI